VPEAGVPCEISIQFPRLLLLVFFSAVFSSAVWADLPSVYGKDFARQGASWGDVRPPREAPTQVAAQSRPELAYQRQLDDFESVGGPYADKLSEPLLGLGRYYAGKGEYERAIQLFRRALHVVRLSDGLYSEQQAPFVRELLDTIRLSGDLQALDDRYDYFFRLYGSGEPPYTPLRMRASLEYLRWQREVLRLGFDSQEKKRLLELYQLNDRLLNATWESGAISQEDQWDLAVSQIRNLYLLLSIIQPRLTISGPGAGSMVSTVAAQNGDIDFDQKRLETIQRGTLSRGESVLQQYIGAAKAGYVARTTQQRARANLELGDWYQWNGSNARARKQYSTVVKLLVEAGEGELMQAWFGGPVELPDNGAFWQPPVVVPGVDSSIVTATYDVTAKGRVKNLTVDAADQTSVYKFKRELKNTRFRPRYDASGESVSVEKLTRKYQLYD